eukprot:CAMPEP_0174300708 /NCGR_PEP_ID=MMETSP0809-20121228/58622_1 /TAXON_ID=73025 ORGANISM="Eutreptiella gymnastica-like, Strain CCMP1594" /NCGR_SAMPLE_ID=MMETSP0809 /ASSEMBLY_ACC=CAM_ASM_000658 /LENGTH=43 /DNA_ID= /DNA_START= /DNA_END= /DNA_ORIENTATION=
MTGRQGELNLKPEDAAGTATPEASQGTGARRRLKAKINQQVAV